ncbi:MAG: hypothetical protein AAFR31_13310 [Cyanobacteria bacterium J06627_8]
MIIADAGFFFALANRGDRYHSAAVRALEAIDESLITTFPVITETCYLLLATDGNRAQCSFLRNITAGAAEDLPFAESSPRSNGEIVRNLRRFTYG